MKSSNRIVSVSGRDRRYSYRNTFRPRTTQVCELHLAEWWKSMNLRARSVRYLADGTSVNTISTANTKLAISENTACNGCRWK